ncbi:female-specific lacrimal gland protein-like [Diceros bicornis minor]|uniref:female-specific lacrimal gland protein-like n=1 Tax=Diceros bicornis minor TaxID=77932 RepID=UPI0026F3307C|nr:female-specific lacrimal gland protein-like [Diceros bicornis minor]
MKILLLTLVLGLVWADQEPQSEDGESLITGKWYTISIASNDIEKICENGSLRGYVRRIECSNNCDQVYITLYQKINGVCQKHTAVGTRTKKDSYAVTSRERSISEEDYQKFKELTEDKGIPKENIEDVITTGSHDRDLMA